MLRWRDTKGSPPFTYGQGADWSQPYYNGRVEQWFQSLTMSGAGFTPGSTGKSLCVDPVYDVIHINRDGNIHYWAGVHGHSGDVDGPGEQARFRIGGLQGTLFGVAQDTQGRYYVTDTGNGKIKRLTERPDKSCIVDTFAIITCETLVSDALDNFYTAEFNVIRKIDKNGVVDPNGLGVPARVTGLMRVGDRIFFLTLGNAATVIWELLPNFTYRHIAGLNDAQVEALGGILSPNCPVDGPGDNCSFFTTYFSGAAGNPLRLRLSSGDENRLIDVLFTGETTVQTSTLCVDGQWHQLSDRRDPNRFVASNFSGVQPNGLPYGGNFPWINTGGVTYWKELFDDGTGGGVPNSQFISQQVPTEIEQGKKYSVKVKYKNTGVDPWSEAALVRLMAINPRNNQELNWPANGNRMWINGTVQPGAEYEFVFDIWSDVLGPHNFQAQMVVEGVSSFGQEGPNVVVTTIPTGGSMQKTLSWTTQMQDIPGGDHYKITINGTPQPPVPYDQTSVQYEVNAGDVIEAQTADAADNWLAPAQSITVPAGPQSKIIISLQLS